jgi:hypothetical protein
MSLDGYPEDRGLRYVAGFMYSLVVAVFWIPAAVVRRIARSWREIGTESWPRADGTITSGDVRVIHGWVIDYALGRLDYSYRVHGEYYSGHLVRQFADEQSAWDFVDSRRDQPVLVRYKDDHAEVSVVRSSDQMMLSNEAPVSLSSQLWQHWRDLLGGEAKNEDDESLRPREEEEDVDIGNDAQEPRK